MSPKAKYRATPKRPPKDEGPGARARWTKRAIYLVLLIAYAAVMWYVVFPWADRTFINQPSLIDDEPAAMMSHADQRETGPLLPLPGVGSFLA